MKAQNLHDIFVLQLQDMKYVEEVIIDSLPKVIRVINHDDLKEAIERHLDETKGQLETVKRILQDENSDRSKKCESIDGLKKEVQEAMELDADPAVRDTAIISALQRIEHYEIAAYGTLVTYAQLLEEPDYEDQLAKILDQEKAADKKLTEIATGSVFAEGINDEALVAVEKA